MTKKEAAWQHFAEANDLTFKPERFLGKGAHVVGEYRGYAVKLESWGDIQPLNQLSNTHITLSIEPGAIRRHLQKGAGIVNPVSPVSPISSASSTSIEEQVKGLIPANAPNFPLADHIHLSVNGAALNHVYFHVSEQLERPLQFALHYTQPSFEKDLSRLQFLFDLLCDLAEGAVSILAIGGEAAPTLQRLAQRWGHPLEKMALDLLAAIGLETRSRLMDQARHSICSRCVLCCREHYLPVVDDKSIIYYGCRQCGQSRDLFYGDVVAVLDDRPAVKQSPQGQVWRVNWLGRQTLFDFHQVEIGQVTDETVERFAVQVGNDTDPARKPAYKTMSCLILPEAHLLPGTLRILARTFGQVVHG